MSGTWFGAAKSESLAEILARHDEDESSWLLDGLVHDSITVMAAPPKAGKSAFAVGLIAALSRGVTEFLGQPLRAEGSAVIFTTDASSKREYARRLRAHKADSGRVSFIDGRRMADVSDSGWQASVHALTEATPDLRLVVVDNVLGVLGDSAPSERLNRFYLRLQDFNDVGSAVLVLHHTAVADETGYGKGRRPQGGRSNETSARQVVTLLPPGQGAPGNVLRLDATGNDLRHGKTVRYVELQDLDGAPTVVPSTWIPNAAEKRGKARLDTGQRIADLAEQYDDGNMSRRALAKCIFNKHGDELGLAETTIRDKLKAMCLPDRGEVVK